MTIDDHPRPLLPGSEDYINDPTHFGIHPGEEWPDDVPRNQDDTRTRYDGDPKGARRAELRIAAFWIVTLFCGLGLAVTYCLGGQPQVEGSLLALGFGCLGVGFILWARDLLPGHDVIASRGHHSQSPEGARSAVVESLGRGLEPMARRPFLGKVLGLVGGVFGVAVFFPLASLGPRPKRAFEFTAWGKDVRLLNEDGFPVKPGDIVANGILTVFPASDPDEAQSASILINLGDYFDDFEVPAERRGWTVDTLVCFSKICTHAGCPVGLYNTIVHQLVCPCHQSTFDVLSDCKPVFGPAPRSLPQLPLGVDSEGYLVSTSGYDEPVGPGYWNRK
jgi:ubiquinol-cytochrome c reductase iron-sulfur subunit